MRNILHLCREYGQPPSWWETLDLGDRALMLADLRERTAEGQRVIDQPRRRRG